VLPEPANEKWFRENGWAPPPEAAPEPPEVTPQPEEPASPPRGRADVTRSREQERRLRAVPASEIKIERTEWLWAGRVPLGEVTLLSGYPGLGKSMLTVWLAAQHSLGRVLDEAGVTLIATAEDSPERTVVPRLRAWEADLTRVRFLQIVEGEDEALPESIVLPRDVEAVRQAAVATGATLIVIDPLMAHLEAAVDSYNDQKIRQALKPLYFLARDLGCAVVTLLHLNKSSGSNPLLRIGGSMGLPAAARSALLLARDPDDPDGEQGSRRILAHVKCNVGPEAQSLLFEIEPILIPATETEPQVETARIEARGESELTGSDLLGGGGSEKTSKLEEAMDFLREALAHGTRPSRDVKAEAEAADITPKTLRRAREKLSLTEGLTERRETSGRTSWELPGEARDLRAHGTGARGHEGTDGHEAPSPSPEPSVPLVPTMGTEASVPLFGEGHEASSEPFVPVPEEEQEVGTEPPAPEASWLSARELAHLADAEELVAQHGAVWLDDAHATQEGAK
jgi:AAA domain